MGMHELQVGNDHPKSNTLNKRVASNCEKSIPCWVCEIFPYFCPDFFHTQTRKKSKAGHQPLLTQGMDI